MPERFQHRGPCWWMAQALGFIFAPQTADAETRGSSQRADGQGGVGDEPIDTICARVCRYASAFCRQVFPAALHSARMQASVAHGGATALPQIKRASRVRLR